MGELTDSKRRTEQQKMEALYQHLACALRLSDSPSVQILAGGVQWQCGAWACRYDRQMRHFHMPNFGFSAVRECGATVKGCKRLDQLERALAAHEAALVARHDAQVADTAFEAGWPGDVRCM